MKTIKETYFTLQEIKEDGSYKFLGTFRTEVLASRYAETKGLKGNQLLIAQVSFDVSIIENASDIEKLEQERLVESATSKLTDAEFDALRRQWQD